MQSCESDPIFSRKLARTMIEATIEATIEASQYLCTKSLTSVELQTDGKPSGNKLP